MCEKRPTEKLKAVSFPVSPMSHLLCVTRHQEVYLWCSPCWCIWESLSSYFSHIKWANVWCYIAGHGLSHRLGFSWTVTCLTTRSKSLLRTSHWRIWLRVIDLCVSLQGQSVRAFRIIRISEQKLNQGCKPAAEWQGSRIKNYLNKTHKTVPHQDILDF